jgi:hypothetical protein
VSGDYGGRARLDKSGRWQTYTKADTNSALPDDFVTSLAPASDAFPEGDVGSFALGSDGALWIGTGRGLVRLDSAGLWHTYAKANTNGGLPEDPVQALSFGPDGALWVGTAGYGVARLDENGLAVEGQRIFFVRLDCSLPASVFAVTAAHVVEGWRASAPTSQGRSARRSAFKQKAALFGLEMRGIENGIGHG